MDPYLPPRAPVAGPERGVPGEPPSLSPLRPGRRPSIWARAMGPILAGVTGSVITLVVLATAGVLDRQEAPEIPAPPTTVREVEEQPVIVTQPDNLVSAIAQKAVPSIVTVQVGRLGAEAEFFSTASGSGVVYRGDGYIITNNHVVAGDEEVQVIFPDGKIYPATVAGTDPLTDLAVLKVGAPEVTPISIADLSDLSIGDLAVAVGNPLALRGGPSVTSGIISALDRALEVDIGVRLFGLIQTDAPITRGSSGGALLNEAGELIGITTAIGTSGISAEGVGFAVPANIVRQVADDLIRDGEVRHAFLGITGGPAFESTEDGASLPIGAKIQSLEEGSAMGEVGAREGDIIVALDGHDVASMDQLVALLRNYRADQVVSVTLLRDGDRMDISVTLDVRPEDL